MTPLSIGVVGFGNFGRFLSKTFISQGHRVIGVSRSDYTQEAKKLGCEYVRSYDEFMNLAPDVVLFCTSIMSLERVLDQFPVHRLANLLVVDVLSVKKYPQDLLLRVLPKTADILCTHPMFGPESGGVSWEDLPFVYDLVRVAPEREALALKFLKIWRDEKCRMVEMSCAQHDTYAASTQFITHMTGRMLAELQVSSTPINTAGFESLLGVVDSTCKDSFDLFYGLFKYNSKAKEQLKKLESALARIREKLEEAELAESK